ncbi:MAG: hypothetical protein V4634_18540 [Pseudomonadota bacterium]
MNQALVGPTVSAFTKKQAALAMENREAFQAWQTSLSAFFATFSSMSFDPVPE